jgi:hypothetical protein
MMREAAETKPAANRAASLSAASWLAAASVGCLGAYIVNGGELFYFDTLGYVDQGLEALEQVGLVDEVAVPAEETQTGTAPTPEADAPRTVDGSRSAVYSLLAGGLAAMGALDLLVPIHLLAVLLAVWIPARALCRTYRPPHSVAATVSLPVLVASLGSLPFFVAYLMPDIFAPVMLVAIATLTAFVRDLRWWEIALTLALGSFSLMAHLSHQAIGALMVAGALVVTFVVSRRSVVPVIVLVGLIAAVGLAQQAAFRGAAKAVASSEVVIRPFITARLIQDGPGLAYLERNCPDAAIPTCKLYEALSRSDDPMRLTASHIVFQTTPELGSFRLMTEADQVAVAQGQVAFFFDVLREAPFGVAGAFLRNTLVQTIKVDVEMTLQTDSIVSRHAETPGLIDGAFSHGNLTRDIGWLVPVTAIHAVLYALSLGVILVLLVRPGGTPKDLRVFAVMLLLGILANAFVCGAISQPATRYGARVIWLLPYVATLMLLFRNASGRSEVPA